MEAREEATPVPERAWALRNVASTLALGGPGERARARTLLEKAVTLKEQWLDSKEHPGTVSRKLLHALLVRKLVRADLVIAGGRALLGRLSHSNSNDFLCPGTCLITRLLHSRSCF